MGTGWEFAILGPLEVRAGGTLVHVGGPRQRALLGLLLCHANRVVSRDELIEELLGDQAVESAERMLRVQISRLRQALGDGDGPGRLVGRPPGYVLRVGDGELDLQVFEQRVAAGRAALERGDPGQAAVLLGEAESLWRGRPLADLEFEPFARLRSSGWRSCGCWRPRTGSRRSWRSATTARCARSWGGWSPSTRCGSGCVGS